MLRGEKKNLTTASKLKIYKSIVRPLITYRASYLLVPQMLGSILGKRGWIEC